MAAAIRRGQVKISEPILWVEGVPAQQQAVSAVVEPQAQGSDAPAAEEGDVVEQHEIQGLAISTDEAAHVANDTTEDGPSVVESLVLIDGGREGVESQATVIPATPTDVKSEHKRSIFVEDDMAGSSPPGLEKKKARRSGTIRTVLRSVFGRKKKRQSRELTPPSSRSGVKHEYSQSVSTDSASVMMTANISRNPSLPLDLDNLLAKI